ncbi:MAG: tRNA preQ1(34) S-adenosylmethionine ribosyltransferase-isomerase QueA, partial [Alphaproteobacteria bacterium]|nr:tRNA preQ1(34) S-adenosylmethionine ribosyltransferase-isomerase QueA [Alphaproteobacteria bacterium]
MYHTSDFDFDLPSNLIASHPLEKRDASRMLVVAGKEIQDKHIRDFLDYLQPGDVVVFNNSRVIPARFDADDHEITLHTAVSDKDWWGLCKKFNKINIGDTLTMADGTKIIVMDKDEESGLLLHFDCENVFAVLDKVGKMPLPPYMKREEETSDRERYQTVYAEPLGSMAAPTAGLHFTDDLLNEIEKRGAKIVKVTLHVGAGTWMPVKTENLNEHKMHSEWCCITPEQADIINNAKRIIAVGTTSMRTLESAHRLVKDEEKRVMPICQNTDIFITPGYKFGAVDVLLTNFHLPKSTLFMLVSAFTGLDEMKAAYKHA